MEFEKIISVTGKPGLFELLSTRNDGVVVRSLDDNSKKFASNRQHQFSHLESIEVYTTKDNTTLREVLIAMKESETEIPDPKSDAAALRSYFEKVYPEMDFDRVFNSDLKKLVKWFGILTSNNVNFSMKEKEEKKAGDETEKSTPDAKHKKVSKK